MKRVIAAPAAKMPSNIALLKTPNAPRAAKRKNRTMNQVERALGIFIFNLLRMNKLTELSI